MDKALSLLRKMEVDKALDIFYQLLAENPNDESLIARIYPLEKNASNPSGLNKIVRHIFCLDSKSESAHFWVIKAYADLKNSLSDALVLSAFKDTEIYNLLFHLGQTTSQKDVERLVQYVKANLSEKKRTPEALFDYCEQLVLNKKWILAKQELEYLMIYYTESKQHQMAEKLFKKINQ